MASLGIVPSISTKCSVSAHEGAISPFGKTPIETSVTWPGRGKRALARRQGHRRGWAEEEVLARFNVLLCRSAAGRLCLLRTCLQGRRQELARWAECAAIYASPTRPLRDWRGLEDDSVGQQEVQAAAVKAERGSSSGVSRAVRHIVVKVQRVSKSS